MQKAIKATSLDQGRELIAMLVNEGGVNEYGLSGYGINLYYYIEDGIIKTSPFIPNGYKLVTVEGFKEGECFPRIMRVSNSPLSSLNEGFKRVVFFKTRDNRYVAWAGIQTLEGSKKVNDALAWKYAGECF